VNAAETAEPRLTIDLWRTTYILPASHPAAHDLRARLDKMVASEIPEACARWLSTVVDTTGESVWLIRELDVDFAATVGGRSTELLPAMWAKQLALAIRRALTEGASGDRVLHFPNRAAYLAQFVRDFTADRAWSKWWYDEFESLRSLPVSRAIREALCRDPAHGVGALADLAANGGLRDAVSVLTPADAGAVYHTCRPSSGGGGTNAGTRKWAAVLLESWNDQPLSADGNPFRDALWLFAQTISRHPGAALDPDLAAALDGLLELRAVLASIGSAPAVDRLIRSIAQSDSGAAAFAAGDSSGALRFFAILMQGDADWGADAAGVLLSEDFRRKAASAKPFAGQSILSPFGGIFRLGPSFAASGFAAAGEAPAALRHLLSVKCLGSARAPATAADPAVRRFSGCEAAFPVALESLLSNADLKERLAALLRRLVKTYRYEGSCLLAETITLPEGSALLFRDVIGNEWIWTSAWNDGLIDPAVSRITSLTGIEPRVLIVGSQLRASPTCGARIIPLEKIDAAELDGLAREFRTTPERLSRLLRPAERDAGYFSLGRLWPAFEGAFDMVSTLEARAVLRHFARRLIGFDSASPEHLYANFLAGRSLLRDTGERIEVELLPPPLSVVLRMAGIQEETYSAPWIGREICLQRASE